MTGRRPGEWPAGLGPAAPSSAPTEPTPARAADVPEVHVPEVRLVAVVDLTGRYDSNNDVRAHLREQARGATDCHTAVVRLGSDALRHSFELGHAIAGEFFLTARRIEIEVPAGTRHAYLADEVRRSLRFLCADHAQMISKLRAPD
ncbi:hypothetical protein [Streptomyces acidiscabies]|uniref:hypothetical protein n=1 Tax=Streptomyces acidiscabies TaxID=42234 RepID=UPI000951537D|nr:hypothetical protein [Streptomyces acidiscabies]